MADVLCMAALKVGNPIVLGVSVEADDLSLHVVHSIGSSASSGTVLVF